LNLVKLGYQLFWTVAWGRLLLKVVTKLRRNVISHLLSLGNLSVLHLILQLLLLLERLVSTLNILNILQLGVFLLNSVKIAATFHQVLVNQVLLLEALLLVMLELGLLRL
jgi:hypothetical protein